MDVVTEPVIGESSKVLWPFTSFSYFFKNNKILDRVGCRQWFRRLTNLNQAPTLETIPSAIKHLEKPRMATNVFVSFDHEDRNQVNGFSSLVKNPNHPLDFHDHSLKEPILDRSGKPIKYPPNDIRSKPDAQIRFFRVDRIIPN